MSLNIVLENNERLSRTTINDNGQKERKHAEAPSTQGGHFQIVPNKHTQTHTQRERERERRREQCALSHTLVEGCASMLVCAHVAHLLYIDLTECMIMAPVVTVRAA